MRLFNIITASRGHDIEAEGLVVDCDGAQAVVTLLVGGQPVAIFVNPESVTSEPVATNPAPVLPDPRRAVPQ